MYFKMVRSIECSTFLIDRSGILGRAWRGLKVADHVEDVLAAIKALPHP
ncbi:MAG: hypothetical protein ABIS17_12735 [Casimicrobiaceae bacterium]